MTLSSRHVRSITPYSNTARAPHASSVLHGAQPMRPSHGAPCAHARPYSSTSTPHGLSSSSISLAPFTSQPHSPPTFSPSSPSAGIGCGNGLMLKGSITGGPITSNKRGVATRAGPGGKEPYRYPPWATPKSPKTTNNNDKSNKNTSNSGHSGNENAHKDNNSPEPAPAAAPSDPAAVAGDKSGAAAHPSTSKGPSTPKRVSKSPKVLTGRLPGSQWTTAVPAASTQVYGIWTQVEARMHACCFISFCFKTCGVKPNEMNG